ncbi:S-adenosyl-L-methionine-dependent methyltransferase [Hypoxylon sp. FL1857]|nr:S-adenosyl-L-methionine-dependent methyltransferase [Hypoxylon sp. FL1857]
MDQRTAKNSAAYMLDRLQLMRKNNPHLKLLDVGTGPGTISVGFAQTIPEGYVTAVDLSSEAIRKARGVAEEACMKNIEFLVADIRELPFSDETFDITHCHQVLTHIGEPWNALRELLRVTKAGGIVAVREGDLETECVWPESAGILKFHQFVARMMKLAGGSVTAGRQLLSWALMAGAKRDQITLSYSTWSYNTASEKNGWARAMVKEINRGQWRDAGLRAELATEQDFDEMAEAWEEWAGRAEATLAMIQGEIIIQKQ